MGVKKTVKSLFNFSAWMGADELRRSGSNIKQLAKSIFSVRNAQYEETFEQAVQRFNLSEADLKEREKAFGWMALFYGVLMGVLLAYMAYLWVWGTWSSVLMTLILSAVMASLAFRQHFWYFQVRERRLGCTFKEWFFFLVGYVPNKKGVGV